MKNYLLILPLKLLIFYLVIGYFHCISTATATDIATDTDTDIATDTDSDKIHPISTNNFTRLMYFYPTI